MIKELDEICTELSQLEADIAIASSAEKEAKKVVLELMKIHAQGFFDLGDKRFTLDPHISFKKRRKIFVMFMEVQKSIYGIYDHPQWDATESILLDHIKYEDMQLSKISKFWERSENMPLYNDFIMNALGGFAVPFLDLSA